MYILFLLLLFISGSSQNAFEQSLLQRLDSIRETPVVSAGRYQLYPNSAQQGVMVPTGWGGYGPWLFASLGGAYPQVYSNDADLAASAGFAFGDPVKAVFFAASININDISAFDNLSYNFSVSRSLSPGTSVTLGSLGLFASRAKSDAPEGTYYVAVSHAVQSLPSKTPYRSRLSYTIGVGNERFLLKSQSDILAGRGKYGTGVFGAVSYEIVRNINLSAEWTGMNLALSAGADLFKIPISLGIGVTNLTNFSADKPNIVFSAGYALSLKKIKP